LIAGGTSSVPLLKSFGTAVNQDLKSVASLLEDKGDKDFTATQWPVPPKVETCERAVKSLARIHAQWWESPVLGTPGFERSSVTSIDRQKMK
jgi:hypothetical protein